MSSPGKLIEATEWEELKHDATHALVVRAVKHLNRETAVKAALEKIRVGPSEQVIYPPDVGLHQDVRTELHHIFDHCSSYKSAAESLVVARLLPLKEATRDALLGAIKEGGCPENRISELAKHEEWLKSLEYKNREPKKLPYLLYWCDPEKVQTQCTHVLDYYLASRAEERALISAIEPFSEDTTFEVLLTHSCGAGGAFFKAIKELIDGMKGFRAFFAEGANLLTASNLRAHRFCSAAVAVCAREQQETELDRQQMNMLAVRNCPVVFLGDPNDVQDGFPEELATYVPYDLADPMASLPTVREELYRLAKPNASLVKAARALHAELATAPEGGWNLFQTAATAQRLAVASSAIKEIKTEQLRFDIGLEHSFLTHATPLFHQPENRVIAFSIDRVSTFWLNQPEFAEQYARPPDDATTTRIWVFSSPFELIKHRNILDQHYEMYGQRAQSKGVVLVTTMPHYQEFLRNVASQCGIQPAEMAILIPPNKDWGIIKQANGAVYRATLDQRYYEVRRIRQDNLWESIHRHVHRMTELATNLTEGALEFKPNSRQILKCARWGPIFSATPQYLLTLLEEAFGDHEPDVYHLLLLSADESTGSVYTPERIRRAIANAVNRLKQDHSEYKEYLEAGMEEPWIGKLIKDYAHPEVRELMPVLPPSFRFLLIIKFKNQKGLEEYYLKPNHLKTREAFYRDLVDDVSNLVQDELIRENDGLKRRTLEHAVAPILLRLDFAFDLKPEDVLVSA